MALAAVVAAAASAQAGTGGTSMQGECAEARFGERALRLGDCGSDVKVLNSVLRSKDYGDGVPLNKTFDGPTDRTVREFEKRAGIEKDGIVDRRTHRELKRSMSRDVATWYGPGFWGSRTACGRRLEKGTVGVAHRKLPCGTKVTFSAHGEWLHTRVIDRGPYTKAKWDLTRKAARELDVELTEKVRAAVVK